MPQRRFGGRASEVFPSLNFNLRSGCGLYIFVPCRAEVRYNCRIIDLNDRSIIASITGRCITSDLAICTANKALASQAAIKGELLVYGDHSSQYASKAFVKFCKSARMTQSMDKGGYLYDNAPMGRYFNTLKNEFTNLYEFQMDEALYRALEEFAISAITMYAPQFQWLLYHTKRGWAIKIPLAISHRCYKKDWPLQYQGA